MNIEQAKKDLLRTMESIDKDKLSLSDLRLYADTLKIVSEIQTKNYMDALVENFSNSCCSGFNSSYKIQTVADMK